ncbi:MAG: efflux RND transporter periplasmic adaptor subunit [Saprospiraceae bacterium]|nr:efflux RND transporter periplasmic adaptor subunit [Saprospiraceae bacterium]
MKKKIWIIIGSLAVLFAAWFFIGNSNGQEQAAWETATLEKRNIEMIVSASGTLNATNTVEVGTQVSGVINEIYVDFNDEVKKGQLMAKLDVRNLEASLSQANASVLQAEVQVMQKKRIYENTKKYNSGEIADLSVVEAEASLNQIKAQMEQGERNYLRYKELYEKGVVAKVDYETSMTDYEQLKASYESKKATLNRTKANVGNVDLQYSLEDLRTAEANLASMKASKEKAKINLEFAHIYAPIDGIVLSRNVEVGQTVAASFTTPVLFTIANDLTKMEIEASIDEADIGYIKNGQAVNFTVDAYTDLIFTGTVEAIRLQPEVVSNVVTYTAIVTAKNEALKLMPGMTANLDIVTAKQEQALSVPDAALNFSPSAEYIEQWRDYLTNKGVAVQAGNEEGYGAGILWTIENNQPVPKKTMKGLSDGGFTEIISKDFSEGKQVIIGMNGGNNKASENKQSSPFLPQRPGGEKKE